MTNKYRTKWQAVFRVMKKKKTHTQEEYGELAVIVTLGKYKFLLLL